MVGPWPYRAFTFRALSKTYGQMWLRCDVCRRYARLKLAGLHDVDYRTKTFSCSVCGSEAYFCLVEPIKEFGMHDVRLDEVEKPEAIRTPSGASRSRRGARCRAGAESCPVVRSMAAVRISRAGRCGCRGSYLGRTQDTRAMPRRSDGL
jgi:hypothetical protein